MSNIVEEAIAQDGDNYVFNAEGTGPRIELKEFEAGRAAKGLRLHLQNKVDAAALAVVAEGDPTVRYAWDARIGRTMEQLLRPGLNKGMNWQPTGREDPGYTSTSPDGRTFAHQISAHHAALLFASVDAVIVIPHTDRNERSVNLQIGFASMTAEQVASAQDGLNSRVLVRI